MRKYLLLIFLLINISSFAQFHLVSLNKNTSNALSKVIEDYPNHFSSIRGDVISRDVQSVNYSCTVNLEGADSSIIIQNGEEKDNIFSWKQVVFESDDFDEVKSKFHEYFNKIKGTSAMIDGNKVNFNATYNPPDEMKRFASIIFTSNPTISELKNVVIDLNMQYLFSGWQISVNVYEHTDYGVDGNN